MLWSHYLDRLVKEFVARPYAVDSILGFIKITVDNSSVLFYSKSNKMSSDSKHIEIKYFEVRDKVKERQTIIKHIYTEAMIVDPWMFRS